MPDIFISYSREDQVTARRFAEGFQREGFDVWWDQTLNPGDAYDHVTEQALKEAKAVAVLWSKNSVESRWVRAEATLANRNHTLVPAMIEPCERPVMFELTHTVDLSHWRGDPDDTTWQTYVAGLRRFVQKDGQATVHVPKTVENRRKRLVPVAIGTAAVVLAALAMWAIYRAYSSSSNAPEASREVTLAVLPFSDLSQDKDQEYIADGLSEEILNQVAQVEGLRVTARTSSFVFKGKNEDMRLIGKKLGVANLLEGSVRKDGTSLRISAQLIKSRDGAHLWSQTYSGEAGDVFTLQENIARDVARALSVKLDVGETSRVKGGTTILEAYDRYLRALSAFGRGEFRKTLALAREATQLDPSFVNAWMVQFNSVDWVASSLDESSKAKQEIGLAVDAIAPNSWQALFIRASSLDHSRKWLEMKAAYDAAYAAADRDKSKVGRETIGAYDAHRRRRTGDISGAEAIWEPLLAKDPTVYFNSQWQQAYLFALGRTDAALAELDRYKTLEKHPLVSTDLILELRFRKNVDADSIWAQYSDFLAQTPLPRRIFEVRNDSAAARKVLHQAFTEYVGLPRATEPIALWADYFGDKELALQAMARGLNPLASDGFELTRLWYPYATGLRSDPRFKEIVRGQGLVDYWRASGEWGDFCKPVGTDDFECH